MILGAGGAGLFAALHAHAANPALRVTIVVKGLLGKCGCTRMVQGGYNVALAEGDSVERPFMDTIEVGKWLPNQELADFPDAGDLAISSFVRARGDRKGNLAVSSVPVECTRVVPGKSLI